MLASVKWLNRHLSAGSGPVSADEADRVLTNVGFPIEARQDIAGRDVQLDVELTSNRGDCLCHAGLAREIAAATGRTLVLPDLASSNRLSESAGAAASLTSVDNQLASTGGCPRFTARLIKGVKVGPSPKWMVELLDSVGQRSINNIVDVSNFILFELGHPCHTFDLSTLSGKRITVRSAHEGETLIALDDRKHSLTLDDMVVADADRAVSIAGVIGGLETSVTAATTDVLLEMATWDPVLVRRAARRLDIRTDASHRFERYVDARALNFAALRAAELIVEVAGGEIIDGLIDAGRDPEPLTAVELRAARCEHLLGIHVPIDDMVRLLETIGITVSVAGSGAGAVLHCTIPPDRHDLTREVDLIEEVVRLNGFDKIGIAPTMDVHLELDHPESWGLREHAMQELGRVLTGMGFNETVTFSFLARDHADLFCTDGLRLLRVDEERRKDAPYLRPSLIPSLLTCRKANQDGRVHVEGGIRLFETASVYAEVDDGDACAQQTVETRNLALLVDAPGKADALDRAVRLARGAIETLVRALGGPSTTIELEPTETAFMPAVKGETAAAVIMNGSRIGYVTTITAAGVLGTWDLDEPVVAAEVNLDALVALYPPSTTVHALPKFPSIQRDLSVIVDESLPWMRIAEVVKGVNPQRMVGFDFLGSYRGKQTGAGKKSITLSLEFRDDQRTLRHDEVDPQVDAVVQHLTQELGAELRR